MHTVLYLLIKQFINFNCSLLNLTRLLVSCLLIVWNVAEPSQALAQGDFTLTILSTG